MARPPYRGRLHYFIGSTTRALVIERLVKHPENEPYLRELARDISAGLGALHREVTELERIGLVRSRVRDGRRYYSFDTAHPLGESLCALVAACDELDRRERAT